MPPKKLVQRDYYLNKLKSAMGSSDIKIITGVRRSGKSTLLESFANYVKIDDPSANIVQLNYNDLDTLVNVPDYLALNTFVKNAYNPGCTNYLIIDEVQMCQEFEKAINSFHASGKFDIYITGSNAFLLSSDLATLFTGRTWDISVFPFSLSEFMQYYDLGQPQAALPRYLTEGGMPGSYERTTEEEKRAYLKQLFDTLLVKDIIRRYNLRDVRLMDEICDFLCDNLANLESARSITRAIVRGGGKASDNTIGRYLRYLREAFAFYRVRRFDIRGKKYLSSNDKYYLCDHSFRFARIGTKDPDRGRLLENIVAIELLRRGYELYAGVLSKKEIDFVAIKGDEKVYFQVCDDIGNPNTAAREFDPLMRIRDANPKVLLTRTWSAPYVHEGVRVLDVADWLANVVTVK